MVTRPAVPPNSSSLVLRAATRANSAATKNALAATRTRTATRPKAVDVGWEAGSVNGDTAGV